MVSLWILSLVAIQEYLVVTSLLVLLVLDGLSLSTPRSSRLRLPHKFSIS